MTVSQLLTKAREALAQGDLPLCASLSGQAYKLAPQDAEARFLIGMTLAGAGKIRLAGETLLSAVKLAPRKAEYQAQLAHVLILARNEADARRVADTAAGLADDSDPLTLDTIGCVYSRLGDHGSALPLFRRAVAHSLKNTQFRFNLATSLGFFGLVDEAEREYEAIIALDPAFGRAYLGLSGLRKQSREANHVARMEQALESKPDPVEALRIHYAIAKECEDIGDYEGSYAHLSKANRDHKQRLGFDLESDRTTIEAIMASFADPDYFAGTGSLGETPIFITGMPRTGTTLADTILSAHRDVTSAGELQSMPLAIKQGSGSTSRQVLDRETIEKARTLDPEAIGRDYIARARQHSGARSGRFTDKFPLNFLYIGYIARALPHAPIVCLRRDPMDTVWSNYKNLFATGSTYYGWSYSLMDTAGYYLLFDRMMAFWKELFPGRIFELRYETLIADQEGVTRQLLDHCGLPWDDACLSFHRTSEAVATPSALQVRKPLNAGSIGKWRAYAQHMKPVQDLFAAHGIACEA